MKKQSTGWLFATVMWSLVAVAELYTQNFQTFKIRDVIFCGVSFVLTLSCLYYFFKEQKKEKEYESR